MAGISLETAIKAAALERIYHYRVRLEARTAIPVGREFPFDLRARLKGTVSVANDLEPPVKSVLTPQVLALAAAELGVKPAALNGALTRAATKLTVTGKFLGHELVNEDDPHTAAILAVDDAMLPTFKQVPRAGALRTLGRITWYRGSTISGEPITIGRAKADDKPEATKFRRAAPRRRRQP